MTPCNRNKTKENTNPTRFRVCRVDARICSADCKIDGQEWTKLLVLTEVATKCAKEPMLNSTGSISLSVCRSVEVLVSLNNGRSFISSPITITATTCVSELILMFWSSDPAMKFCSWGFGSFAVGRDMAPLAPAAPLPPAAAAPAPLVPLATLLHGGQLLFFLPACGLAVVRSGPLKINNISFFLGDKRSSPLQTASSCS